MILNLSELKSGGRECYQERLYMRIFLHIYTTHVVNETKVMHDGLYEYCFIFLSTVIGIVTCNVFIVMSCFLQNLAWLRYCIMIRNDGYGCYS